MRARTGYGLDTCHLFASGYDLTASADAMTRVLDEFEEATGEPPGFFHLNDSEGALGSNKDRHVLIGDGQIGSAAFERLVADRRSQNVPLVLETPQLNYEIGEEDPTPDPYDLQMMAVLEAFIRR
jgi:endonuclease IV